MFKEGFLKTAKDYFVYRNVHKGKDEYTYSLKDRKTGRVTQHRKNLILKDPVLKVSDRGRERVLSEGVKNVHAGIFGSLVARAPLGLDWIKITYDPRKDLGFVTREGRESVLRADFARLTPKGVEVADEV